MTWTYDPANPTDPSPEVWQIRTRIGDVLAEDQLLQDEAIAVEYANRPHVVLASIACLDRILASIARDVNASGAGLTMNRESRSFNLREVRRLLYEEARGLAVALRTDTARRAALDAAGEPGIFSIGMDDFPGGGG